jgi:hypothetical protein
MQSSGRLVANTFSSTPRGWADYSRVIVPREHGMLIDFSLHNCEICHCQSLELFSMFLIISKNAF